MQLKIDINYTYVSRNSILNNNASAKMPRKGVPKRLNKNNSTHDSEAKSIIPSISRSHSLLAKKSAPTSTKSSLELGNSSNINHIVSNFEVNNIQPNNICFTSDIIEEEFTDFNCLNCGWKFPEAMTSEERNFHINLCMDGSGEEHKINYLKNIEYINKHYPTQRDFLGKKRKYN